MAKNNYNKQQELQEHKQTAENESVCAVDPVSAS